MATNSQPPGAGSNQPNVLQTPPQIPPAAPPIIAPAVAPAPVVVPMSLWSFILEKIFPNLAIWFAAYVLGGKYLYPKILGAKPIDWSAFFDLGSLGVFLFGVMLIIAIAHGAGKWSPQQLAWLLARVRDEASSAIVSVSSIGIFIGLGAKNLAMVFGCLAGYLGAWFFL